MQIVFEALCMLALAQSLPAHTPVQSQMPAAVIAGQVPAPQQKRAALFDERADAREQIAQGLERSRFENRRVLIQWGANGDDASRVFREVSMKDRNVAMKVLYEYEVVLIDVGQMNRNQDLAKQYGATPSADGLPYVTVLDQTGKVLANQSVAPFKTEIDGRPGYDSKKLLEFLTRHQAEYLKAMDLFNEGLTRAKREDKLVFLRFAAPW